MGNKKATPLGNAKASWQDIDCENLAQDGDRKICTVASSNKGFKVKTTPYLCSICLNEGCLAKKMGNRGMREAVRQTMIVRDQNLYKN